MDLTNVPVSELLDCPITGEEIACTEGTGKKVNFARADGRLHIPTRANSAYLAAPSFERHPSE